MSEWALCERWRAWKGCISLVREALKPKCQVGGSPCRTEWDAVWLDSERWGGCGHPTRPGRLFFTISWTQPAYLRLRLAHCSPTRVFPVSLFHILSNLVGAIVQDVFGEALSTFTLMPTDLSLFSWRPTNYHLITCGFVSFHCFICLPV